MIDFLGKRIESAIFDMDGTMFDTERLRFQTIAQASLELAGRPIEERTLIGSLGLSAVRAEALAKEHYGEDYPYREIRRRAIDLTGGQSFGCVDMEKALAAGDRTAAA